MRCKLILKFYFNAESLNEALDNLLLAGACKYCEDGLVTADRLYTLIEEKTRLGGFWRYLDGVVSNLPERDREALKYYARLRCGYVKLDDGIKTAVKRALMKFKRRARGIGRFAEEIALAGKYYCLLG